MTETKTQFAPAVDSWPSGLLSSHTARGIFQEVIMKRVDSLGRPIRTGLDIHNWHGGRTKASHGYILIRVHPDKPGALAYEYEHRIVAEKKLGRPLIKGEIVHHINRNKTDNRPENISVVVGNAEHFVHHRRRSDLRLPGEENPIINCECGCGKAFRKYDAFGRPRTYVSGHNPSNVEPMIEWHRQHGKANHV